MIYFEVKDTKGKLLSGNIDSFADRKLYEESKNFSKHQNGIGIKGGFEILGEISIWVIVDNEPDLLKSSKLFTKTFELYKVIAQDLYRQYKKEIDSYSHILDTIQGQIRQKIDDFATDKDFYGETYQHSLKKVLDIIEQDKESAADLICYIQKRILDMRAHLLGTEIVHSGEQYEIKPVEVRLKRAILNQCAPFLEELEKNSVEMKFFFEDDCRVEVDKNMFSLVMYNFFSNTQKYVKPNSEIRLKFFDDSKRLDISMISLKMDRGELTNLHKEGVRGSHAKNLPGKGIGLFVIDRALDLMGKNQMFIDPNYDKMFPENDEIYVENHFQFQL